MGLRLYSEFKSSADKEYKIEIYDSEWSLPSSSFNVAGNGFELSYSSETDNIVSPIIGSKCTIKAYNNTDVFDTFINDLTQYQEKRFTVKIIVQDLKVLSDFKNRVINDGGTFEAESCLRSDLIDLGASLEPVTYWTGIITQDLATEEDVSKPRIFEITATDGIGHLANKEYETISNVTIESFIESAAGAIGLDELYSATDPFYATTVNVWDTNHTYSATTDVSTLIRFDSRVYTNTEEDGTVVYSTYLDILRELCTAFGARFYQKDGIFHFEQYLERAESTRTVSTYQFNGTLADTSTVEDDVTLDQTSAGGARMAGNMFNYLPALKKVQVAFDQNRTSNLLGNNIIFTGATGRKSLGFVPDDNNGRLQIDLALSYQLTLNTTPPSVPLEFYRPVWKIEVRIEDVNNPGTYYYLKRDWTPGSFGAQLYGATSWTTTASYYYIDAGISKNDATGLFLSGPASLVTPPLPVDGTVEIDINFDKAYDISNAAQTTPTFFDETITSIAKKVLFINDAGSLNEVEVFSATNDDANINSNLILDLGKLRVSDAVGLQGSFFVYDGSGWVRSTQWRRGNTGSFASLFKLLTKEILSLHKKPIERYNGTIIGAFPFGTRYEFDNAFWIPLSGDYDANMDEWRCEWFAIDKIESNITASEPVGSGLGAGFSGLVSGQQGTDEVITAVDIRTTDSVVSRNATVGGRLNVTGDVTMSAGLDHRGYLIENITEIEHEPGDVYTIGTSEYMIFNKWRSGAANGTSTINLPAAGDNQGRLLRFKSDGTISSNHEISLVPDGSDTIDGAAEFSFSRDYDGVMILAHDGEWFIVQRKSK